MNVRQVSFFLAVVDHGNIRRAAIALGLAQPSVSQGISGLEHELGVRLFDRIGQGVVLTAAGSAFLGPARRLVRTSRRGNSTGTGIDFGLDFATWGTLAIDPTSLLIAQLREENPALEVRIEGADDDESVCELVRHGHCEIGTVFLPAHTHGLQVHPIGTIEQWLVLPPGSDPGPGPLPLTAVSDYSLVSVAGGSQTAYASGVLAEADVQVHVGVVSAHREAMISLVVAGAGAALAPEMYARQASARGAVIRQLDPPIARRYAIIHRPGTLSHAAQRCVSLTISRRQ